MVAKTVSRNLAPWLWRVESAPTHLDTHLTGHSTDPGPEAPIRENEQGAQCCEVTGPASQGEQNRYRLSRCIENQRNEKTPRSSGA